MVAHSTGQGCVVNPSMVSPSGVKYTGSCLNGLAEGDGTITFSNGNTISGKFSKNILQEGIVEFYFSENKSTIIGPYKNGKLNGRFVGIDKTNSVYTVNYLEGRTVGNTDDYFNIPEPKVEASVSFPISNSQFQISDFWHWLEPQNYAFRKDQTLVPTKDLALIERSGKVSGSKTEVSWLSLYDYRNNQIIRDFGDLNNPVAAFLCFDADYSSIYVIQIRKNVKGVYKFNLSTGASEYVSRFEDQKILDTSLLVDKYNSFNKYPGFEDGVVKFGEIDHDSNLIYSWTNSGMFKLGNMNSTFSLSKLNGEKLRESKFEGAMIRAYAVNELANQLYISFESKDKSYISLFELDSFKFVKTIFDTSTKQNYDELTPSPLGSYLGFATNGIYRGTLIYKGDQFFYAIAGRILSFNKLENVVIAEDSRGNFIAHDLENRKLLWMTKKLGNATKPIKIDNDLVFFSKANESLLRGTVDLVSFELPDFSQTFFSLNMEVQNELKRQNEEFAKAERLRKEQELKSQEEKKNEEKKATDALYQKMAENYLLWIFKEAFSGLSGSSGSSSNQSATFSNSTPSQSNSSSKIYQRVGYSYAEVGKCENGKIYQRVNYSYQEAGKYEDGKIYQRVNYSYQEVGKYEGCGAAAAFLLLF